MINQCRVVPLGGKGDLITQVGQAVVDRCSGQHEHPRFHALPDDLAHQPIVACLAALAGRALVAEVVRLVDDDEVVIAPIDVGEVDIARQAAVARQIRVVENIVVETVAGEEVATVVGAVKAPVVAQALGAQDQYPIVAELVVFDDGKRLEGFPKSHAVGNDAAAEPVEFVDGTYDTIALELVELLPHHRVADSRCRLDDLLLVQLIALGTEEVVQDQRVDAVWVMVYCQGSQQVHDGGLRGCTIGQCRPLAIEPAAQPLAFFRRVGSLYEVERIPRREAQPVGAERERAEHGLPRAPVTVAQDDRALWNGAVGPTDFDRLFHPVGTAASQPAALEPVACGAVRVGPEEAQFRFVGRQNKTHFCHSQQLIRQFPERMEGKGFRGQVHLVVELKPGLNEINHAIRSRVGDNPHRGSCNLTGSLNPMTSLSWMA